MAETARRRWATMFAEHGPGLRGFFVRRGARDDAEDLVQETYARLLHADRDRGATIANPEAYLFAVAQNLARERALHRRRAPLPLEELEPVDALRSDAHATEDAVERAQYRQRLQATLDALPARTREVLVLQYRDGLTYRQIGERLGMSAHMVKKHVVRGLAMCRRAQLDAGEAR
ncbi:sigma-70 family RNA polymerase sigma factor [Luteimonas sp. FCS-9]|uniref:RNA polymerase sigma factor n=1 Tax=Luteimonas sp. FCS-9 TaxID=1547516 RepID=UPI00063E7099|nr:sigma-70 family RNA polymerase sigma factor [Luteimonas sp. FCS-9]KLJ00290.1 RNA polymerase sigma70 [Luteimonas sp. FCS-9]